MDSIILPFFVQVDPCPISSFTAQIASDSIRYMLGDGIKNS